MHMATNTTQKQAAKQFAKDWSGKGYEKGETSRFWIGLLQNVFGIQDATKLIEFELPVKTILKEKGSDFIDGYIPSTKVLIEQKGSKVDLGAKYRQSDGSELTPYQQARRYAAGLPVSMTPRWIVACNFTTFEVHDMERPNDAPEVIRLANLEKEYTRLSFLVDDTNVHLKKELEVSIQAGEIVGVLYDKILAQYRNPEDPETQKSLNKLCVRLVFCLYAEDAGIFGSKDMFHDYMAQFGAGEFREKLIKLFRILDQKPEERDPYEDEKLLAFPYVNGGMFAGDIEIPRINEEIRDLILQRASDDFDWSLISPTIFGAVFESTLNPETRRSGGMHYTSIENIHKVIDPLFLNDLKAELADIKATSVAKTKRERAFAFQDKLAGLKFFDPACGSGNFLTESYTSLRRLENEALRIIYGGDRVIGEMADPIKVSINQFYGIEINDFACSVAQTALWIAESQMMQETDEIVGFNLDPLPLKAYHNIREGNALRMDWSQWPIEEDWPQVIADNTHVYPYQYHHPEEPAHVLEEPVVRYGNIDLYTKNIDLHVKAKELRTRTVMFDYIMGNPPFVANAGRVSSSESSAKGMQNAEQKEDKEWLFGKEGGVLDYVSCWFKKASFYIRDTKTKVAFVSTSSICEGQQVAPLWKSLLADGVKILFAYQSFKWGSEASDSAVVYVIIVGFSSIEPQVCKIYDERGNEKTVNHINPYLLDAPDVFVDKRTTPLCDVPVFVRGCQPTDNGNFILTEEEREVLLSREPNASQFIRPFMMGKDFIDRKPRYCLWLKGVEPAMVRRCPAVLQRVENVRNYRLKSTKAATRIKADTPMLFDEIREPSTNYVALPTVSSGNRLYIPIDYLSAEIIPGNKLYFMQGASYYHFGIITSIVHMGWMRAVGGYFGPSYNYSNTIVYNNFPWPTPSDAQKEKIEHTAQGILDARALYPESSLADLYDNLTMPPELRKAHRANDAAVLEAYGFPKDATESDIVARLFKMYQELTK